MYICIPNFRTCFGLSGPMLFHKGLVKIEIYLLPYVLTPLQGGDADTNGSVAGAMLACKLRHTNKLPKTWTQFKHKEWLDGQIAR